MDVIVRDLLIKVHDFVPIKEIKESEEVSFYVTDSEVSEDKFEEFFKIYKEYSKEGKYFTTIFDSRSFHGRFGQLNYSKHDGFYKLRLAFVRVQADGLNISRSPNVTYNAGYMNLRKKLVRQEIILENLLSTLEARGVLESHELEKITFVNDDDVKDRVIEMNCKVDDLREYLKSEKATLHDLRERYEVK